jgi:glucosylceramidase
MNRIRILITRAWLVFFLAACGAGNTGGTGNSPATVGDFSTTAGAQAAGAPVGGTLGAGGTTVEGRTTGTSGSVTAGNISGSGGRVPGDSGSSPTGGAAAGGIARAGNGGTAATDGNATAGSASSELQVITSTQNAFWQVGTVTEVASETANVTVNDASAAQTWEGFGGTFNEMGWRYLTTVEMQDEAMQLLFGPDGCRFAWGRIPIGASDFAMDRYTDDEVASGTDTSMSSFSINRDKEKLIPYIKAAQAVKPDIRFWASPWSPPTWMKTGPFNPNTGPSHSAFDGGVMKNDEATLKAYAQYLVKWVQAFQDQGIKVEYVAPQNEPNYEQNYPSCHWVTTNFVNFIKSYLGPALTAASSPAQIMLGTLSNNGASADAAIANAVLADPTAKDYCKVVGVQWGMSDANQINNIKGKTSASIWLSETKCGGTMGSTAPAPNDFNYAKDTWTYIRAAIKNGLTAYNAWNMVLDRSGLGIDDTRKWPQNALLVADSGKLTQTPAYYVYRHFSRFVDPGAKVVATSGGDAIAFKNPDGSLVAVMHGTSVNNSYVVSIGGKNLQFAMPIGWATVKYKP